MKFINSSYKFIEVKNSCKKIELCDKICGKNEGFKHTTLYFKVKNKDAYNTFLLLGDKVKDFKKSCLFIDNNSNSCRGVISGSVEAFRKLFSDVSEESFYTYFDDSLCSLLIYLRIKYPLFFSDIHSWIKSKKLLKNVYEENFYELFSNSLLLEEAKYHQTLTVRVVCSREVFNELLKYQFLVISQSLKEYEISIIKELIFVLPLWIKDIKPGRYSRKFYVKLFVDKHFNSSTSAYDEAELCWLLNVCNVESTYLQILQYTGLDQWAKNCFSNSLKTEFIVTADLEGWEHFFKDSLTMLSSQMQEIMKSLHYDFVNKGYLEDI